MRRLPLAALLLFSPGWAGAAPADAATAAVTYKGVLGDQPIVVEIAVSPADGFPPFGRFAYMAGGTDIPLDGPAAKATLDGSAVQGGTLRFEEEARCKETTCLWGEDDTAPAAPIRADWTLARDGADLAGTRTERGTGRSLPIRLERRGERPIEIPAGYTPAQALMPETSLGPAGDPPVLDPEALPYDFLKLDWPRTTGPETKLGAVVLRMETDERTGVGFPVVVTLGGPDTRPINAYLLQQRLQAELPSFSCRSQAYLAFSWSNWHPANPEDEGGAAAPDGPETATDGPDRPNVTIDHVSPRLIGLSQSNSFFCGGAHPDNYTKHFLADARTGAAIGPETLLAGWTATGRDGKTVDPETYDNFDESLRFAASEDLLAYVRANRLRLDESQEADCPYDDLLADGDHFGVYVAQDDLVFTPRNLPHAIFACTEDLLSVPLAEARPLLTIKAAGYFSVLDK